MLTWAYPFNICCFLDNQGYQATPLQPGHPSDPPVGPVAPVFECLLAVGATEQVTASPGRAFADLQAWAADRKEWLFGHFAYDLATETEPTVPAAKPTEARAPSDRSRPSDLGSGPTTAHPPADPIGFPALFFFVPEIVITLQQDSLRIGSLGPAPETIWQAIGATAALEPAPQAPIAFEPRFTREEYLETIRALRNHILRGDCYEINFCQEFYAQAASFDPWAAWQALSQASPNPFSAFYRTDKRFLLCASPERFLKRTGTA